MSELTDSVYLLSKDFDRFRYIPRGDGYDLKAFSANGIDNLRRISRNKVFELPNPTFFYQCECKTYLNHIDSLEAVEGCPIFSQKMIDVLLSVREFAYKKYPIVVLEERGNVDPYKNVEEFKRLSLRDDLFIFQTLEFLDIFDWEKSEYEQDEYDKEDNIPGYIRQFALKTPDGGFPPLFRLPFKSSNLFISKEAREALKEAGITGNGFKSLLRPMDNPEVDVPIQEIPEPQLDLELEKRQNMVDTVFSRAEEERAKGNIAIADRLEQKAHDLMRDIG
jgi:hypothetical protein